MRRPKVHPQIKRKANTLTFYNKMKATAAVSSILLLSKNAFAGYSEIESMIEQAQANLTTMDRNLGGGDTAFLMGSPLEKINGYGCWCFLQEEHGQGAGEAQNEVDAHCQTLHHGYSCVKIDASYGDENCPQPWAIEYNIIPLTAWMFGGNSGRDMYADCKNLNQDSECAARTCAVESFFTLNLIGEFLSMKPFDATLKHSDGWSHSDNCPRKLGSDQSPLECCGEYPPRFPYKTKDGQRGCCGDKTYDTNLQECCSDNTLSLVC